MTSTDSNLLAIALGANLPSHIGSPISTFIAVRPVLENVVNDWLLEIDGRTKGMDKHFNGLRWRWSPLYETTPIGGPNKQEPYINAVLAVDGGRLKSVMPSEKAALNLLERFLKIEKDFGRDRTSTGIRWGPRSLDLDLLGWGTLQVQHKDLTLPHPRLIQRNFVIVPLGEALNQNESKPRRISAQPSWPE